MRPKHGEQFLEPNVLWIALQVLERPARHCLTLAHTLAWTPATTSGEDDADLRRFENLQRLLSRHARVLLKEAPERFTVLEMIEEDAHRDASTCAFS